VIPTDGTSVIADSNPEWTQTVTFGFFAPFDFRQGRGPEKAGLVLVHTGQLFSPDEKHHARMERLAEFEAGPLWAVIGRLGVKFDHASARVEGRKADFHIGIDARTPASVLRVRTLSWVRH